jgi:hypothetical protein
MESHNTVTNQSLDTSVLRISVLLAGTFVILFLISVVTVAQPHRNSSDSNAGFFVEPMITYEVGKGSIDYPSPLGRTDVEREGLGLGARVGLHVADIFFIGADARYSKPKFNTQDAADSSKVNSNAYNIGPTVGVQTPYFGVRVWGTYIMDGMVDPNQLNNGIDIKLKNLEGYRVGLGAYIQFVSVNIEYQKAKYGSLDLQQVGPLSGPSDVTGLGLSDEAYILSVSFPITL